MSGGSQLLASAIVNYVKNLSDLALANYNQTMQELNSPTGVSSDMLLTRALKMTEASTMGFWGALISAASAPTPLVDLAMDTMKDQTSSVVAVTASGVSAPVPTHLYRLGGTEVIRVSEGTTTYIGVTFSDPATRNELLYEIQFLQSQHSPIPAGLYLGWVLLDSKILATVSLRVT